MGECAICGKNDVGLLYARHRERGGIWLCNECWENEYKNIIPSGSGGSCCGL